MNFLLRACRGPRIQYSSSLYFNNIKVVSGQRKWACDSCSRSYSTTSSKDQNQLTEVYYGTLTRQIKLVKTFSLTTSVCGIAAQPILYKQITALSESVALTVFAGSFVGFFTFGTPLLLHYITKKYVTYIHYDAKNDEYVATLLSIFLRKKELRFRPEDIEQADIPGMFTSFYIKGQPVFIDSRMFHDVSHYVRMMGYDKPMDFKLEESTTDSKNNSTKP